jgi:hypothetical protein
LFFKCKLVAKLWNELQMSQVCNSVALLSSAKEVIKEILKMKSDIQTSYSAALYMVV